MPRSLIPWVFAGPATLVMVLGLAFPVIEAATISLYEWRLGDAGNAAWRGLALYAEAFRDPATRNSLAVTALFSTIVVTLEMVAGVALALALERPTRAIAWFRTAFILPMMIAPICVGLIWRYLFDTNAGPINALIGHPVAWLADPQLAFLAIVVTDIWQWTPFVFIMALAGLQGIDASITEAARVDGARGWRIVFWIKLPLLRDILVITLLMRLIDAVRGLEVVYVLTFGGPGQVTELFSLHIYKAAFIGQRLGYASVLSILMLLVVGLLSLALVRLSRPAAAPSAINKAPA